MSTQDLRQLFYKSLLDLASEDGINASSKDEVYGCIFGRDSAITILKILNIHKKQPSEELLQLAKTTLKTLVTLQGQEFNIESGEEPGKFIHEFRKDKYERLINRPVPWYVYADGKLRNYDSIDSTPLTLIALYKYWETTKDGTFLLQILDSVEKGLNWIITFGDRDKDFFIEYEFPENRKFGGLLVQSWTDSFESLKNKHGNMPKYPIAPIEAQSFAWLALKLWSDFYQTRSPIFSKKLASQANALKNKFNETFLLQNNNLFFGAQALDGQKNQITTITANPMLTLWSAYKKDGKTQTIVNENYIEQFVKRAFQEDLFVEDAGIRTMSAMAETFNPGEDSYHNGSFWPMLNGLIIEGLENFNFTKEAEKLKKAASKPLLHFGTPIELYIKLEDTFIPYQSTRGQTSCKHQAWSAAAALDWLTT